MASLNSVAFDELGPPPLSPLKIAAHQFVQVIPFSAGVGEGRTGSLQPHLRLEYREPVPGRPLIPTRSSFSLCLCFISQTLLKFSPFYFS